MRVSQHKYVPSCLVLSDDEREFTICKREFYGLFGFCDSLICSNVEIYDSVEVKCNGLFGLIVGGKEVVVTPLLSGYVRDYIIKHGALWVAGV